MFPKSFSKFVSSSFCDTNCQPKDIISQCHGDTQNENIQQYVHLIHTIFKNRYLLYVFSRALEKPLVCNRFGHKKTIRKKKIEKCKCKNR